MLLAMKTRNVISCFSISEGSAEGSESTLDPQYSNIA